MNLKQKFVYIIKIFIIILLIYFCFTIIVIIYRSPSYSKAEFCENLQQFLEDLCEKSDIIIAGEFNIYWQSDFLKVNWKAY